jgi:hypothetical protein
MQAHDGGSSKVSLNPGTPLTTARNQMTEEVIEALLQLPLKNTSLLDHSKDNSILDLHPDLVGPRPSYLVTTIPIHYLRLSKPSRMAPRYL